MLNFQNTFIIFTISQQNQSIDEGADDAETTLPDEGSPTGSHSRDDQALLSRHSFILRSPSLKHPLTAHIPSMSEVRHNIIPSIIIIIVYTLNS